MTAIDEGVSQELATRMLPSRAARWLTLVWALPPLVFGLPAAPCFAWAAWRLRSRALAVEATTYLAGSVLWVVLANQKGAARNMGSALALVLAVVACGRALTVRRRLLGHPYGKSEAAMAAASEIPAPDPDWTPVFPAEALRREGQSIAAGFACDGHDRHPLSMSFWHAVPAGVAGVTLIALDLLLHFSARALGTGIGLLLFPLLAVLFRRWVEGPVLYYGSWGRVHKLQLSSVTKVAAAKGKAGRSAVLLFAPGLAKPLRISLEGRGYSTPTAAREHLRVWLSAPRVQWTPAAAALFGDDTPVRTSARRRLSLLLARALFVVLPLFAVGGGVLFVYQHIAFFAIPGAPGYATISGPRRKPLPVGRPWGRPCQPIRFVFAGDVPNWIYEETAGVVTVARHDGLDVTMERPDQSWSPTSLYYLKGQNETSSQMVDIWPKSTTPPHLSDGQPDYIDLGWDTRLDGNGANEDLTLVQATMWMQNLNGNRFAVRRAVRQLISLTQGIGASTSDHSGVAGGTRVDRFTRADIAAMKVMSGCRRTPR